MTAAGNQRNSEAKFPPRVSQRPSPELWKDDELMTLAEAKVLFWPEGPLTVTSLRTAVKNRQLEVAEIAGKLFTTRAAIARMSKCAPRFAASEDGGARRTPPTSRIPSTVAEFRRQRLDRGDGDKVSSKDS